MRESPIALARSAQHSARDRGAGARNGRYTTRSQTASLVPYALRDFLGPRFCFGRSLGHTPSSPLAFSPYTMSSCLPAALAALLTWTFRARMLSPSSGSRANMPSGASSSSSETNDCHLGGFLLALIDVTVFAEIGRLSTVGIWGSVLVRLLARS